MKQTTKSRRVAQSAKRQLRQIRNILYLQVAKMSAPFRRADIAIFHQFAPPPDGGGHQFLRALWDEFVQRGLRVENNSISATTRVCLANSFNFDFERLRRLRRAGCRMVHRVDGPIDVYRGRDDGADRGIWEINRELMDLTVFQSQYSLHKHLELGLEFRLPCVIMNAANPDIFHAQGRELFSRNRKIRLISTSWSNNPNKGAAYYKWLDEHLDWDRFEYTFVGRSPIAFQNIRMYDPVPSEQLACILRQQDIYITASQHDPCSNALIEALNCGLPALYLDSGGHPEIVGAAGLPFTSAEAIPELLDEIIDEFEMFQTNIAVPSLTQVADRYLRVMGVIG